MSIIEKAIAKLNQAKQSDKYAVTEQNIRSEPKKMPDAAFSNLQLQFNVERISAAGIVAPSEQAPFLADEFRRIKRPLLNYAFDNSSDPVGNSNVIMVTSSLPGEGKSFLAVNLALSIALEKNATVLLIDADVIMPKITKMFSLEDRPGLTDKLESPDLDLAELLLNTDVPGLSIISAGKHTASSAELLSSNIMKNLIKEMASRYTNRVIIFDSPSLLTTPESSVLAEQMGQIVMVVEANKTPQSTVSKSLGLLNKDKAIGIVLNKTSIGVGYN
jgi:protein-tyrosine kinase